MEKRNRGLDLGLSEGTIEKVMILSDNKYK